MGEGAAQTSRPGADAVAERICGTRERRYGAGENTIKWTARLKNIHEECAALEELGEEPSKQHEKWRAIDEKLKVYTSMLAADADAASRQRTLLMPPRIRCRPA